MTTTPAMPERFTKKPVTVEAVQFTEALRDAIVLDGAPCPDGVKRGATTWHQKDRKIWRADFFIDTLEWRMNVEIGDWIIKGVKGEFYPCKPDIFEMTYDHATLQAQPAAAVSDATINRVVYEHTKLNPNQADDRDLLLGFRKAVRALLTQRPAAQTEREAVVTLSARIKELISEHGTLRSVARSLNLDVGYLSRLERGEKVSPSPETLGKLGLRDAGVRYERLAHATQQATPDLADGPARMHWTNWMPVKDALEYAYQKMGLEMVKTDAGAKYPNLHWNLAGLVREFVVAQQDAMFGKCQACGKNVGLLDQIKCLDCGTRLCEPCAKEHFGSDHGARAAASHSHPAPTTSGWVETSAPPRRLDWSDTQQATPEPVKHKCRHCGVTTIEDEDGVTMQGLPAPEHPIIFDPSADVPIPATPEPVGEVAATVAEVHMGRYTLEWNGKPYPEGTKLYTRPAPGVPEGFVSAQAEFNQAIDFAIKEGIGAAVFLDAWRHGDTSEWPEFAAAQAKGGEQ